MALFLGTDVINKKSPQYNLASCFYNHNELDLRNGFFRIRVIFLYQFGINFWWVILWVKMMTAAGDRAF
jgi:hypothetical protein